MTVRCFSLWRENQCLPRGYLHEQTKYTCTTVAPKMIEIHFARVLKKSGHALLFRNFLRTKNIFS